MRDQRPQFAVIGQQIVFQTLDQRFGRRRRNGRNDVQKPDGDPTGWEGDRHQQTATPADPHKMLKLFLVAQYFRSGRFQHAMLRAGMIEQFHQIMQQIF
ncbi:hypothetical protein D3C78_1549850 [compost metagenome]